MKSRIQSPQERAFTLVRNDFFIPLLFAPSMSSDESQNDIRTCITSLNNSIAASHSFHYMRLLREENFVMPVTGWYYPCTWRGIGEAIAMVSLLFLLWLLRKAGSNPF